MRKRVVKIFLVVFFVVIILPLFWLINVNSDLFPNSHHIQIGKPGISSSIEFNRSVDYYTKTTCKSIYWMVDAQTDTDQTAVLQYYDKKWNQTGYFGGTDIFPLLTIMGTKQGIFIVKYVLTPAPINNDDLPLKYTLRTEIQFCKIYIS